MLLTMIVEKNILILTNNLPMFVGVLKKHINTYQHPLIFIGDFLFLPSFFILMYIH
jgi:hypothetical protein